MYKFIKRHVGEVIILIISGFLLYLVYNRYDGNLKNQNVPPQNSPSHSDEPVKGAELIGISTSGKIYYLREDKLLYFPSITSFDNLGIAISDVEVAKLSNNSASIACIANNNLVTFSDYTTIQRMSISKPNMWVSRKLQLNSYSLIAWSPNDDKIAFTAYDNEKFGYLLVALRDGTKNFQITENPSFIYDVLWTSNDKLIFLVEENGKDRLIMADSDGGSKQYIQPKSLGLW